MTCVRVETKYNTKEYLEMVLHSNPSYLILKLVFLCEKKVQIIVAKKPLKNNIKKLWWHHFFVKIFKALGKNLKEFVP